MPLAQLAAIIAVLSTGVIYGTDVFCALVHRPAWPVSTTPRSPLSWAMCIASATGA